MQNTKAITRSRILVVGADHNRVAELESVLMADGYLVRCSVSGCDALEQSRVWRPEIVIADGTLVDMEIPSFCTVLRTSGDASSILVRLRQSSDFAEVLDAGADDCVDTG